MNPDYSFILLPEIFKQAHLKTKAFIDSLFYFQKLKEPKPTQMKVLVLNILIEKID